MFCVGTGGGPVGIVEALLAGPVLLEGDRLPGVWIVLTGWIPEFIPDENGQPIADTACQAVAFALGTCQPAWHGPRLRIVSGSHAERNGSGASQRAPAMPNLEALLKTLGSLNTPPTTVIWRLDGGGWLELRKGSSPNRIGSSSRAGQLREQTWTNIEHSGAGTEKKR